MSKKAMQEILYWSRRRIKRLRKDDVQMNWKERMEAIFDYIEGNLTQEIYLQEIAKLLYKFIRQFWLLSVGNTGFFNLNSSLLGCHWSFHYLSLLSLVIRFLAYEI